MEETAIIERSKDEIGSTLVSHHLKIGAIFYIPDKKGRNKPEFGKVLSFNDNLRYNSYVFYKPLKRYIISAKDTYFQGWNIGTICKCKHIETNEEKQIYKIRLNSLQPEHFFDSEFKYFPEVGEEFTYNIRSSAPLPLCFFTEEKKFSLLPRRTILIKKILEKNDGGYVEVIKKVDETFF